MSHSLAVRFGLAVFLLVWVPLLAAMGWGGYWLWQRTESRPAGSFQALAVRGDAQKLAEAAAGLAEQIDRFMLDRIVEVQTWADSPVIEAAVRRARAAHEKEGLDELPITQVESKFRTRKSLGLAPGARRYLTEQMRLSPNFAEVFFTDEGGYNVALTNPTSDFVQSDEDWWRRAWSSGFSVGEIEFDDSSNVWSVDLSVRIHDSGTGNPIGVMKAVLSIRFVQLLTDRIANRLSAPGQLLHTQLAGAVPNTGLGAGIQGQTDLLVVTRDGLLVAETRSEHARGRIMQPDINLRTDEALMHLRMAYDGNRSGSFIVGRMDSQDELGGSAAPSSLVAYARSASADFYVPVAENFAGFDWMIVVETPNLSGHTVFPDLPGTEWHGERGWMGDVLVPGVTLFVSMLLASILLCWLFGKWVLAPVRMLTHRVQDMEQGRISERIVLASNGELTDLATALDRVRNMIIKMSNRLKQATAGPSQPRRNPEAAQARRAGPDDPS